MRLKLNLVLADNSVRPAAVTAEATATVANVAAAIYAGATGLPVETEQTFSLQVLSGDGEPEASLQPRSLLSETTLRSGQSVRVVTWTQADTGSGSTPAARLRVIAGPNAGAVHKLRLGPNVIGRDPSCDVVINDHLVSRSHARLVVSDRVEVVDLNSSNGVIVAGTLVDHAVVGPRDTLLMGDTALVVEQDPTQANGSVAGDVEFNRSPLVRPPYRGREFAAPQPPARPKPSKLPLVAMVAPLLMGVILFLATKNIMSIMFVALSPLISVGTYLDRRFTDTKSARAERERFDEDMERLRSDLTAALDEEHLARRAETLSLDAVVQAGFGLSPDLWHRQPDDAAFLDLNLGFGRDASRHKLVLPARGEADADTWEVLSELQDQSRYVNDVPVVAKLRTSGNLGIAGERSWVDPVGRNLVIQLASLHSPAELTLVAIASPESSNRWEWLMWLPHVGSAHSPLTGHHLASSPASVSSLVAGLEELVAARKAISGKIRVPAVVMVVENDAPVERGRLVTLAQDGPEVGVHLVWFAEQLVDLPAACDAYLIRLPDGAVSAGFVDEGRVAEIGRIETISAELAEEFARALSPVLDAGAPVIDQSDIPRSVSYLALTGDALASDPSVTTERWRENGSLVNGSATRKGTPATLKALIGLGAQGEFTLDLRAQGPHALVGGTTGAGKSEFLQSWILGLATAHSPQRVTFLFVDYKGGAAFADCVRLPHTVGLVTDLSPHLVRRALASLRAELRYREHLLNRKKAKDLISLERTGDPECPPSLIIMVDEFAALVGEVPEFVDGVVDVAQRGRSLGLHLVLATQRPAGVITANLRANTNLRIALRMADETDSADVIDSGLASEFDPRVPGRGAVRTGPGRIALFQTGYAGGRTRSEPEPPRIEIETMAFGPGLPWEIPEHHTVTGDDDDGPTDIARVVGAVRQAATDCGVPEPRKPWLPELKTCYDLAEAMESQPSQNSGPLRLLIGIADDPANQAQHPIYYEPDTEGNLAVFGGSGSGKSGLLRTLAVGAALQTADSRTEVYALDFAASGLAMLEPLPTVGAVIDGSDQERIARLMRRMVGVLDERSERYAAARVGSITEYRATTGKNDEPRIIILVDGMSAFRDEYESTTNLMVTYNQFTRLMSEGRAVGIHVALSAERANALTSALGASVQRRLVLRHADENSYIAYNIPSDVLTPASPPGRGVFAGEVNELQVAVPGGSVSPAEQSQQIDLLAERMQQSGIAPAEPVGRLSDL
ncbi:MAG: FHA domain-containing protein, partial [Bifidobacteriaceae bacterium]|nr:FHA domain-containing protein [Bifidobacteriaceae bacterium]